MNTEYPPAAGIIPYYKDLITGRYHVLLGYEIAHKNWSGFVGKKETCDKTIKDTALREFTEETGDVFKQYMYYFKRKLLNKSYIRYNTQNKIRHIHLFFIEIGSHIHITPIPKGLEKSQLKWFSVKDIKENKVLKSLKVIILSLFN